MSLRIRIEHGQDAGRTLRLAGAGAYLLGRAPETGLRVLDMKVSKEHARIDVAPDGAATVTDLGSRHGTLLNGQPVQRTKPLHAGDELRLGLTILRVLSDGEADATLRPSATTGAAAAPGGPAAANGGGRSKADAIAGTPPKPRRELPPDALVGREIGGYKVLKKIGQGGMGSVYVAEQLSLHREVALKVLSEKFTADRNFVDQFVNEARSAAALNHPNVVQVYDVGRENGRYYFSMEFVSGGSLEERLAENGKAPWQDALNWMIDASNALIFANKRDILHRDVKPDNLMLAEDGSAKLCDLGLAKKAANPDMLAAGIIGTPAFISPEAIRRRRDVDTRSDLYSLGCAFYRVLTGQNPYPGKTVKDILIGHLKGPIPRVSEKVPGIPKDLDDVVHRLMQKEPSERYETPSDLLQALDRIRITHGLEAHGIRPPSRKPLVIAIAALVLVLAGALFLVLQPKDTVKVGPTPEEIAAQEAREAALRASQRTQFISAAEAGLLTSKTERLQGPDGIGPLGIDNYQNPGWQGLIEDFESFATELERNEDYGDLPEVEKLIADARREAREIRDGVALRERLSTLIQKERQTASESFETELGAIRTAYDEAMAKDDWLAAARTVDAAAIERMVGKYRDRKIEDILPDDIPRADKLQFQGELLLDPKKHIGPRLAQSLPGKPPGQALRKKVLEGARQRREAALSAAEQAATPLTHEGFAEARRILDEWLAVLPEAADRAEGETAETLAAWRQEARYLDREVEIKDVQLLRSDLEHDRKAWVELARALRSPGQGLFDQFRFEAAAKQARDTAAAMRHAGYRARAAALARDAEAARALLDKVVAAHPDGWTSDEVVVLDEDGDPTEARVKAATAQGLDLGDGVRSWARLGPEWVVERLLFPEKAEAPRIALDPADQRGVAVLAELAIDYPRAQQAWQAYLRSLGPEDEEQEALRARLGRLPAERKAGEAWKAGLESARALRAFLDAHDPDLIGEKFYESKELREEVGDEESELRRLLQIARNTERTLNDPALATTTWAVVLLPTPRLDVAYAGEIDPHVPQRLDPPPAVGSNGGGEAGDGPADPPDDEGGAPDEAAPPEEGGTGEGGAGDAGTGDAGTGKGQGTPEGGAKEGNGPEDGGGEAAPAPGDDAAPGEAQPGDAPPGGAPPGEAEPGDAEPGTLPPEDAPPEGNPPP